MAEATIEYDAVLCIYRKEERVAQNGTEWHRELAVG